jgi:cytochrome b involved in lipid metabolism
MRKLTYTAFIAFWASALTLIFVHQLQPASADHSEEASSYTLEQLAEHGSEQDCWMAIDGKVYDLTEYLPLHPTPPVVLIPWCGRDATEGMRTKGYGRDHSPAAWAELEQYLVGTLAEE